MRTVRICAQARSAKYHTTRLLPRLQPDEMLIIEKMEKMVDPDQPEGEWIAKYDLVEKVPCSRQHPPRAT